MDNRLSNDNGCAMMRSAKDDAADEARRSASQARDDDRAKVRVNPQRDSRPHAGRDAGYEPQRLGWIAGWETDRGGDRMDGGFQRGTICGRHGDCVPVRCAIAPPITGCPEKGNSGAAQERKNLLGPASAAPDADSETHGYNQSFPIAIRTRRGLPLGSG